MPSAAFANTACIAHPAMAVRHLRHNSAKRILPFIHLRVAITLIAVGRSRHQHQLLADSTHWLIAMVTRVGFIHLQHLLPLSAQPSNGHYFTFRWPGHLRRGAWRGVKRAHARVMSEEMVASTGRAH